MDTPTNVTARMDLHELLDDLVRAVPPRIAAAASLEELAAIEAEAVGKRSPIAEARRGLGSLDPDARRTAGQAIQDAADRLTAAIGERRVAMTGELAAIRLSAERVDVTLPGRRPARGGLHVVEQIMDDIVDIFVSIGYTLAKGPEAETEYYNFTALNIPHTHPSRLESDTLYLDYGDEPEEILMRSQTSPMQVRYMEDRPPPVYVVVPGRVFRRDPFDATHSPVFHQVEGLAVDENITFADLKGTLAYFAKELFGPATRVKFQPDYFPFTEPSAQMHAYAMGGWIELLGCGMVHPAVFEHVGYDPDSVTGFAFGMGADRMAMVRHGISDLRYLFDPDVRVLRQFR
ncbi:MAG TPA: phenylalanine--tRNA ligase subunit alpha [Acidimicrobiia bacterium]